MRRLISLRLDEDLLAALDRHRGGRPRNQVIVDAIRDALGLSLPPRWIVEFSIGGGRIFCASKSTLTLNRYNELVFVPGQPQLRKETARRLRDLLSEARYEVVNIVEREDFSPLVPQVFPTSQFEELALALGLEPRELPVPEGPE